MAREVVRRALLALLAIAVVAFAVEGGEYGTSDLVRQWMQKKQLVATVDTLQHQVDSLKRVKQAVLTDPKVQERIAREEFGMVRGNKEILYRFAEPSGDSGKH
ncbi:MAG TPA: septum formation initiator family protein [Gemmatimonadaceae bacterium]|nr:septum formation initiator family protein [Gemmatimonadaceae bacterium]